MILTCSTMPKFDPHTDLTVAPLALLPRLATNTVRFGSSWIGGTAGASMSGITACFVPLSSLSFRRRTCVCWAPCLPPTSTFNTAEFVLALTFSFPSRASEPERWSQTGIRTRLRWASAGAPIRSGTDSPPRRTAPRMFWTEHQDRDFRLHVGAQTDCRVRTAHPYNLQTAHVPDCASGQHPCPWPSKYRQTLGARISSKEMDSNTDARKHPIEL
mmetsp:Transcript_25790/g.48769  ORF Transcript_25790/g.48769 Transcript_25790/m.48769 type:complete len:215 (-) Transcript_25790:185-829(-)